MSDSSQVTIPLREYCSLIVDCPHSTPEWTNSGFIVLRSKNIRNGRLDLSEKSYTSKEDFAGRVKRAIPSKGDLVITREAPMGEVCLIPDNLECCLGQRMVLIRPDATKCDSRYLLYAIQSPSVQHEIKIHEGTGSTVSNLRIPALEALPIPARTLSEQKRIAHILGTLDDKIELNRRMAATLEEMARAIFKSWFIDFDPVHAKAEGRPTGLPPEIDALFPHSFEASDLGAIPAGWTPSTVSQLIDLNPARSLKKGHVAKYLDMANVRTTGLSVDEVVLREFGSGTKLMNGDTLLARITPCLENGKTAYVNFLDEGEVGWGSTEFIVMKPKAPLPNEFAYCLARDDAFRDFTIQSMTGSSGRQRVQAEAIGRFQIACPPDCVAHQFKLYVKEVFERVAACNLESKSLATFRDHLLPRLVSGEINV